MTEYLVTQGNTKHLINLDMNESYSFNSIGGKISSSSATGVLSACSNLVNVDILSILGESCSDVCEIYFQGSTAVVNKGYLDVYSTLSSKVQKADYIVYRIPHESGVMQVLIPVKKNTFSQLEISNIFEGIEWCKLKYK